MRFSLVPRANKQLLCSTLRPMAAIHFYFWSFADSQRALTFGFFLFYYIYIITKILKIIKFAAHFKCCVYLACNLFLYTFFALSNFHQHSWAMMKNIERESFVPAGTEAGERELGEG